MVRRNFAVGDIVLIVDENMPRLSWLLGRNISIKPNSKDAYVRRTKSTILDRPVDKIEFLEASSRT